MRRARNTKEEIERLRASLLPGGMDYTKPLVMTSPSDRIPDIVGHMAELERLMIKQADEVIRGQIQARQMLEGLEREKRDLIEVYFLNPDLPTWAEVETALHISEKTRKRWYREAFEKMALL